METALLTGLSHREDQLPSKRLRTFFFSYPTLSVCSIGRVPFPSISLTSSIGYARIILAVASLYYMPLHPRTCSFLYSVSCLLDALDGFAARRFNQSTKFGAVLDMVTDRCTTACLLVFLSSAWPRWAILFQGLISLDLASHYIHMFATLTMGGVNQSHKKVDSSRSRILNLYYTNNVSNIFSPAAPLADIPIDRPVHHLRPRPNLLHRPVSTLIQLSDPFAFTSPTNSTVSIFSATREPIASIRKPPFCFSLQRRCPRARSCQ